MTDAARIRELEIENGRLTAKLAVAERHAANLERAFIRIAEVMAEEGVVAVGLSGGKPYRPSTWKRETD